MTNLEFDCEIVAGGCSVGHESQSEAIDIANIRARTPKGTHEPAIHGLRWVGLKSRTSYNPTLDGMGEDAEHIEIRMSRLGSVGSPTIMAGRDIVLETDLVLWSEIMIPHIQLADCKAHIPEGHFVPWNPSVDSLGWHIREMANFVVTHKGETVGIKNPKNLGARLDFTNDPNRTTEVQMEKVWSDMASYTYGMNRPVTFIHRGVDDPDKGDCRNAPVHKVAQNVKTRVPGSRMFLDPSHIFGSKLRDQIVPKTVEAMSMKIGNSYLYDGILIEAGTSRTDTGQHIAINELESLTKELSKIRRLRFRI